MRLKYAVCTDKGNVRTVNQDNYYLNGHIKPFEKENYSYKSQAWSKRQAFFVCDGMGGETAGEQASELAVKTLKKISLSELENNIEICIREVNQSVCALRKSLYDQTGTTLAGIVIGKTGGVVVNIGDSRVYHMCSDTIVQLSKDHSRFQTLLDAGLKTQEDYRLSPEKDVLTQFLGIDESTMLIEPYIKKVTDIKKDDCFVICSDGLFGYIDEGEFREILIKYRHLDQVCKELVDRAKKNGSKDNLTAMVVQVISI